MFGWFFHSYGSWTVGGVGWAHGKRGHPREQDFIAVPTFGLSVAGHTTEADTPSVVTPIRHTGELNHVG